MSDNAMKRFCAAAAGVFSVGYTDSVWAGLALYFALLALVWRTK